MGYSILVSLDVNKIFKQKYWVIFPQRFLWYFFQVLWASCVCFLCVLHIWVYSSIWNKIGSEFILLVLWMLLFFPLCHIGIYPWLDTPLWLNCFLLKCWIKDICFRVHPYDALFHMIKYLICVFLNYIQNSPLIRCFEYDEIKNSCCHHTTTNLITWDHIYHASVFLNTQLSSDNYSSSFSPWLHCPMAFILSYQYKTLFLHKIYPLYLIKQQVLREIPLWFGKG